jgi:amino acid adenylation domain-containing protein
MGATARGRSRYERSIRERCRHPSSEELEFPENFQGMTLWHRFHEMAQRFPSRPAIVDSRGTVDYASLAAAASRLAAAKIAQVTRPVGILLDTGADAMVAMLAALRSGRPYLPMDPGYPPARLRYMFEDCDAATLFTSREHIDLVHELGISSSCVLYVEDAQAASEPPNAPIQEETDPALVLYTSGSTGVPKGFTQTHRNILLDIMNYMDAGRFCPADRFLLVSSISFADSLRTIYGALLNGACLYPYALRERGLLGLESWIADNDITVYRSVPTLFRQFLGARKSDIPFPSVRLVYLSGETVYRSDFDLFCQHFSDECILVNRLGTGEALTFRIYYMDKGTKLDGGLVPVGYPVIGKEVVLLDEDGKVVTQPGTGEIAICSSYVTPGYINNPDANSKAFIEPSPGSGPPLYRTGDIGRILADGCLVHLGRQDFQVKIRGARVEIGEIETIMLTHDAVRESVVGVAKDPQGDSILVAYITLVPGTDPSVSDLMNFAEERLPHYMVPSRFVILDRMPLTPSGKTDRKSLPPIDDNRPSIDAVLVLPRSDTEHMVAGLWSEVLGIETIGVHDRFLELGGNSLQAMQIIRRVVDATGTSLSMQEVLMKASTVAEMSAIIYANRGPEQRDKSADRHSSFETVTIGEKPHL